MSFLSVLLARWLIWMTLWWATCRQECPLPPRGMYGLCCSELGTDLWPGKQSILQSGKDRLPFSSFSCHLCYVLLFIFLSFLLILKYSNWKSLLWWCLRWKISICDRQWGWCQSRLDMFEIFFLTLNNILMIMNFNNFAFELSINGHFCFLIR